MENKNRYEEKIINGILGVIVIISICYQVFSKVGIEQYLCNFSTGMAAIIKDIMRSCTACFSMLIFLIGFLLKEYVKKTESDWNVSFLCIKKLYTSYWMLYILFSYLVLAGTQNNPYHGKIGLILLDFFGFSRVFGTPTINGCSWIIGVMIILFFLFPGLKILVDYIPYSLLFAGIVAVAFTGPVYQYKGYGIIIYNVAIFVIGMCISKIKILDWLKNQKETARYRLMTISVAGIGFTFLLWRAYGTKMELLYGGCCLLFLYFTYKNTSVIWEVLAFLGENAVTMILITGYILGSGYREDLLYQYRNFVLMIAAVIAGGVTLTTILEKLKRKILVTNRDVEEKQSGDWDERED